MRVWFSVRFQTFPQGKNEFFNIEFVHFSIWIFICVCFVCVCVVFC